MNTHRFRTALAGAFISLALFAPAADAARFVVKVGPPAARVEVRGHAPSPRHVWVAGGWNVPPRHGGVWIDGHWRKAHGGWEWIPGHWR